MMNLAERRRPQARRCDLRRQIGSNRTALYWQADQSETRLGLPSRDHTSHRHGALGVVSTTSRARGAAKLGGAFRLLRQASYIRERPDVVNAFIKAHVDASTGSRIGRPKLVGEVGKYVNTSVVGGQAPARPSA
jgi:hypothetical protein